jgi:ribosomal protein S18 acetylase RimI-like enzyme
VAPGSPAESTVVFRPAIDADRSEVRSLIDQHVAGTPYADVVGYFLRLALAGQRDESRAVVATHHGHILGIALFGRVAGAIGTGRMHFVGVTASARLSGIGVGLCDAAIADMAATGARLVTAELPDEPALAAGRALLARVGFHEVARIADYCRDGVDLVIMCRTIHSEPDSTSADRT